MIPLGRVFQRRVAENIPQIGIGAELHENSDGVEMPVDGGEHERCQVGGIVAAIGVRATVQQQLHHVIVAQRRRQGERRRNGVADGNGVAAQGRGSSDIETSFQKGANFVKSIGKNYSTESTPMKC